MRSDRLRDLRENRQLTQLDLATMVGVSDQQIYRYEAGKSVPTSDVLARIATTLEVSADYLLGLTDKPNDHVSETPLDSDEHNLVRAYRRRDWREVMRIFYHSPNG